MSTTEEIKITAAHRTVLKNLDKYIAWWRKEKGKPPPRIHLTDRQHGLFREWCERQQVPPDKYDGIPILVGGEEV